MFKKMLLMKMDAEIKNNPAKAEEMFEKLMGKYKELTGADKDRALKDFKEMYGMAKNMKLDNVVKYMDKFKDKEGI